MSPQDWQRAGDVLTLKGKADFTPFFERVGDGLSEEVTSGEECLTLDFRKFRFPGNGRFEATSVQITESHLRGSSSSPSRWAT